MTSGASFSDKKIVAKRRVPPLVTRTVLYERLKGSFIRDAYLRITDRRWIDIRCQEVEFYRRLLEGFRQGDLIFDIGANDGSKTDVFLRLGAKVISVEPDGASQKVLRSRFLRYRLFQKPVVVVDKAVSDQRTVEMMCVDGPGSAVNTLSQKWATTLQANKMKFGRANYGLDFKVCQAVETITLEQLILRHGFPFFIKIDVEGYEIRALRGLRRPVPFLSFELNLPEFRPEGMECVKLLEGLAPRGRFNYAADFVRGIVLSEWLDGHDFSGVLEQCSEESIEVFWESCISLGR